MLGDTCLDTGKMSGSRANWSVCLWISWLEETLPAHPDLRYSMSFTEVNVMTESTFSLGDTICKLKITFTARLREINLWAWWKLKATSWSYDAIGSRKRMTSHCLLQHALLKDISGPCRKSLPSTYFRAQLAHGKCSGKLASIRGRNSRTSKHDFRCLSKEEQLGIDAAWDLRLI